MQEINIRDPFFAVIEKWQLLACAKFLKFVMRGCQDDVNFTLTPLFLGNHLRKPFNKGLQKLNFHLEELS